MARRTKLLSFEPSRIKPGSREEVRVGAYARRQLRRRMVIGVFGALLIVGAFALYDHLRPRNQANPVDRYPVRLRCTSCGEIVTRSVPFTQTFPMECPACKETACQPLWQCRDCGAQFVPERTGTTVRCSRCGSQQVGSAAVP